MEVIKNINISPRKYPVIGSILWLIGGTQYFIVQIIASLAWTSPKYNALNNYISDLGNVNCEVFKDGLICSPLHGLMNLSFILLGILIILGSLLIYRGFAKKPSLTNGIWLILISGLGFILVGLFPQDVYLRLHMIGAMFIFIAGNIGLIFLNLYSKPKIPKRINLLIFASAFMSLFAVLLLNLLPMPGLIERIIVYPQTIWLIIYSAYTIIKWIKTKVI